MNGREKVNQSISTMNEHRKVNQLKYLQVITKESKSKYLNHE